MRRGVGTVPNGRSWMVLLSTQPNSSGRSGVGASALRLRTVRRAVSMVATG